MRFQSAAPDARAVTYAAIQADPVVARAAGLLADASAAQRLLARAVMNGESLEAESWRTMFPTLFGPAADPARPRVYHFVWLEQLIAAKLDELFPGMQILESHPFRITRDAEMSIQELEADDLLETIEQGVRRRRFGSVVRVCGRKPSSQPIIVICELMGKLLISASENVVGRAAMPSTTKRQSAKPPA